MKKEFICIVCPRGCHIFVDEAGNITGNLCKRGVDYVKTEMSNPTRVLTSTVRTIFKELPRVSVKSAAPVPKEKLLDIMKELDNIVIDKNMPIGSVVIKNVLDTGIDIVLTRDCIIKQ